METQPSFPSNRHSNPKIDSHKPAIGMLRATNGLMGRFEALQTRARRIVLIDSDPEMHRLLGEALVPYGFEILSCKDHEELLVLLASHRLEASSLTAIFYGLALPANRGLQAFTRVRQQTSQVPVFLLASREALEAAKAAMQLGAAGYLLKPFLNDELLALLQEPNMEPRDSLGALVTRASEVIRQIPALGPAAVPSTMVNDPLNQLIGRGAGMQRVFGLIRKVAPSGVNVLISGESGSGKEMVASAIHRCSLRSKKPFIAINCAAIPRELLESELFGHAKGAFTGAHTARRGLFEEANEGTVFLDEIGDLPLPLQAKILRLLQTREVKPLGQNTMKEVDVRIISATHKNLKMLIQKGEFREDLYYRLNVMPIQLPPLRERREDIPILAEHFLKKHAATVGKRLAGFSKSAIQKLQTLPWKGNVRELENTIERSMVMADGPYIEEADILADDIDTVVTGAMTDDLFSRGLSLKDIEREYIRYVLGKTGNRKEAATRILGIDRKTLYRKEKLYGIRPVGSSVAAGPASFANPPACAVEMMNA